MSSLNLVLKQTLYVPKPQRPDGTEITVSSTKSSSLPTSANVLSLNHCCFPRSLTSRGKLSSTSSSKRQLPSLPVAQSSEQKHVQHERFNANQLYDLLDHLDTNLTQNSSLDFTQMLDQLTLTMGTETDHDEINGSLSIETNAHREEKKEENILPNLFNQPISSTQEKRFYTTFTLNIDDPKSLLLYTMTLSTVQLSASILLPYSILNGRRPLLKCSNQTNFKEICSKQRKYTSQVTAIESSLALHQLKQNDIVLKVPITVTNNF